MTFQEALESCLRFADAQQVHDDLEAAGIHHDYLSWDEVSRNGNVQLDRLVRVGVNRAESAARDGKRAFVSVDDGNGVHVLFHESVHELVGALASLSSRLQAKI